MELRLKDLEITSSAFGFGDTIPKRYTSDGKNVSPPLQWRKLPPETQQLALICHDPDAPLPRGFTHWTIYNIPPDVTEIAEGGGSQFTEGANSAGSNGYTGPAPPPGHGTHHYYFWLYALNQSLDLKASLNREELLGAIGFATAIFAARRCGYSASQNCRNLPTLNEFTCLTLNIFKPILFSRLRKAKYSI